MTQEKINKYFESELGSQCVSLFSTADDNVFIRHSEAVTHSESNGLLVSAIQEWFEEEIPLTSFKVYRHADNPKEKELHDKFSQQYLQAEYQFVDKVIFGTKDEAQSIPNDYLTDREKQIMLGTIQWLGSAVGEGFLRTCGFVTRENFKREKNYGTPVSLEELVDHYKTQFLKPYQFKELLEAWAEKQTIKS